jgi:hypothetical protein
VDVKVALNGEERGMISFHSLAVFSYFSRVYGFNMSWDRNSQMLNLSSPLLGRKICLFTKKCSTVHPLRQMDLECDMVEHIRDFLKNSELPIFDKESDEIKNADLTIEMSIMKIPNLKEITIEIQHNLGILRKKWLTFFQNECKKNGAVVTTNKNVTGTNPTILLQIKFPEMENDLFWAEYGENLSLIFAMGILAYFQGDLSILPLSLLSNQHLLPNLFDTVLDSLIKKHVKTPPNRFQVEQTERVSEFPNSPQNIQCQVFLDYHLILDREEHKKIKALTNLHIKNTGTGTLNNPIICIRMTPAGGIFLSGQIIPKNFADTFGVMNEEGTKGWKYMNDDWFEQIEEKGEIWIAPIQKLSILPNQVESLLNLQMNFQTFEDNKQTIIEVFVFFKENDYKVEAENRIAISFQN